jgi:hypothetical protein
VAQLNAARAEAAAARGDGPPIEANVSGLAAEAAAAAASSRATLDIAASHTIATRDGSLPPPTAAGGTERAAPGALGVARMAGGLLGSLLGVGGRRGASSANAQPSTRPGN